jgi:transposase
MHCHCTVKKTSSSGCPKDDISHVGCWVHASRKFIDAQKVATSKDKKTVRTGKANVAINYIATLYTIEKQTKDTSSEARH